MERIFTYTAVYVPSGGGSELKIEIYGANLADINQQARQSAPNGYELLYFIPHDEVNAPLGL